MLLNRVQRILDQPVSRRQQSGKLVVAGIFTLFFASAVFFEPGPKLTPAVAGTINQLGFPAVRLPVNSGLPALSYKASTRFTAPVQAHPNHAALAGEVAVNDFPDDAVMFNAAHFDEQPQDEDEQVAMVVPARETAERAYTLLDRAGSLLPAPIVPERLPYVPNNSFDAIRQRDSIIPLAILQEKLAEIQCNEADLQLRLTQIQEGWTELAAEKIIRQNLAETFQLKKAELETAQQQLLQKGKQFENLIQKQATIRANLRAKMKVTRRVVHI
jgi:hypothetical protein